MAWSPDDSAILHQRVRQVEGRPTEEAQLVRHEPGGRETVVLPVEPDGLPRRRRIGAHEMLGSVFHFSGAPARSRSGPSPATPR